MLLILANKILQCFSSVLLDIKKTFQEKKAFSFIIMLGVNQFSILSASILVPQVCFQDFFRQLFRSQCALYTVGGSSWSLKSDVLHCIFKKGTEKNASLLRNSQFHNPN